MSIPWQIHPRRLVKAYRFVKQCLQQRRQLMQFFQSRADLRTLAVDEGTVLFEEELSLLRELIERASALPGPIIEIGTLLGFTTARIAAWKAPEKPILSVDNYSWNSWGVSRATHRALTRRFLAPLIETGHVELFDMDKEVFYANYVGERPALVFLDAIHNYEETRADLRWAQKVGALLITGHDYGPGFPGVQQAVDELGGPARRGGGVWALDTPALRANFGLTQPTGFAMVPARVSETHPELKEA